MPSVFPGALDNIASNKLNTTVSATDHPDHHNLLADAINAIEATLGAGLSNVVTSVGATAPITSTGGSTPTIGVTASALTGFSDANVTLTLGGSPSDSLLSPASITLGWKNQLSPARGGTGVNNGTNTLTIGASASVAGSNTGDVALATNSGLVFTSGQTGLALGTPTTVTSSSTNSVTTNTHTHAVTAGLGFIGNGTAQNQVPVTGATPFAPAWATLTDTTSVDFTVSSGTITAAVLPAGVNHNALANLATGDVHTQYALLIGRSGGQTLTGGTAVNNQLLFKANNAIGNTATSTAIRWLVGDNGATVALSSTFEGRVSAPVSLAIGGIPAQSGELRLSNNQFIYFRNAANTGDIPCITVNASNNIQLGGGLNMGNQAVTGVYSIEQFTSSNWKFDNVGNGYVATTFAIGTTSTPATLSFGNAANRSIGLVASAAGTVGRSLTIFAGDTTAGGTNIAGGGLVLEAGTGTGTGASSITFLTGQTTGTATAAQTLTTRLTIDNAGDFTFFDGADFILGTVTGTKIGTATTQKIGFFNATPIVRPTAYTQTYSTADKTVAARTAAALTNNTGGTISTTLAAITAGAAYTQADMLAVKNALASLADQVNKLRNDHLDTTNAVNAIIDDLQALGLVG